jgi:hypothetical protein
LVQRSFLLAAKFNGIFGSVSKMKEIIIVAGKTKGDVCWLRHCLREKGYNSVPCKSAEQIIEEMEILPTCDATVPLVVIEPEILSDIRDDLIARLSDFALDVPFLLCKEKEEVQADLTEIFERICEYRTVFKREQNPELADVLRESGVEVACG